ncbi:BTB-domain-containing protein [Gigaspora margarita]|uniref:BTB-domain-containing protein n=1 Tax=Gigaspora margarita TaxID=4874 RepID=A0A8H3XKG2_GIGMA|nr:BTB-domain-containing protein [Gigaspora margarita]
MNNDPILNFIKDFSNLLENSEDFDVKIKVGEEPNIKEFKVHSYILSARSVYFKTAFSPPWARRENGIIIFNKPNISPSVFEILINYVYTGIFTSTGKNEISLIDIFIAADEIHLDIAQKIERYLLKTESAWKFPKDFIAIYKYDFTDLINLH